MGAMTATKEKEKAKAKATARGGAKTRAVATEAAAPTLATRQTRRLMPAGLATLAQKAARVMAEAGDTHKLKIVGCLAHDGPASAELLAGLLKIDDAQPLLDDLKTRGILKGVRGEGGWLYHLTPQGLLLWESCQALGK